MDALIILLVGYVILKSIFSGGDDYDKKPKHRKRRKKSSFGMIPLRIPITTRGTDRMGIRTDFKIVKNELICPKLLDIPKESRTFALLESATLPVEQRTRAELFLYIRLWIIQIPLLKFLL